MALCGYVRLRWDPKLKRSESFDWKVVQQRNTLEGNPRRIRSADTRPLRELVDMRDSSPLRLPDMVEVPGMKGISIMVEGLTVGLFKRVMKDVFYNEANHCWRLPHIDKIVTREGLFDARGTEKFDMSDCEGDVLTGVCLLDAELVAKKLSALTGQNFRVPTREECEAAKNLLVGSGYCTWTETEHRPFGWRSPNQHFYLFLADPKSINGGFRDEFQFFLRDFPGSRCGSIRLVMDVNQPKPSPKRGRSAHRT